MSSTTYPAAALNSVPKAAFMLLAFALVALGTLAITESLGYTQTGFFEYIGAAFSSITDGITSLFAAEPVVEHGRLIEVAQ